MEKTILDPAELFDSRQYGFSQGVMVSGGRTVYLSGQVAWDAEQRIIGPGDLQAQVRQTIKNIDLALKPAGGSLADVVSLRIYIVEDALIESGHISAALKVFFPENPPATTWIGVRSLATAEFLIEIEAVAVIDVINTGD